jgi:branched-chain amino acid transport system substrate-binding protein
MFRTFPTNNMISRMVAEHGIAELGDRVFLHEQDNPRGQEQADIVKDIVTSNGGEVVGSRAYPLGHQDFSGIMREINETEPDWVFVATEVSAVQFMKQAITRGVDTTFSFFLNILASLGALAEDEFEQLPETYSGLRWVPHIDTSKNNEFIEMYTEEYGQPPLINTAGMGHMFADANMKAVQQAGSTDADDLLAELSGLEHEYLTGTGTMRECDHQGTAPSYMGKVTGQGDAYADMDIVQKFDGEDLIHPCSESNCKFA